jgi:hypothetical protein
MSSHEETLKFWKQECEALYREKLEICHKKQEFLMDFILKIVTGYFAISYGIFWSANILKLVEGPYILFAFHILLSGCFIGLGILSIPNMYFLEKFTMEAASHLACTKAARIQDFFQNNSELEKEKIYKSNFHKFWYAFTFEHMIWLVALICIAIFFIEGYFIFKYWHSNLIKTSMWVAFFLILVAIGCTLHVWKSHKDAERE